MNGSRVYVCNKWKELQVGGHIKFVNGLFATDDLDFQRVIESNNAFGVDIHWQDDVALMEEKGRQAAEEGANKKARRRNELLEELRVMEEVDANEKAKDARDKEDAELAADAEIKREAVEAVIVAEADDPEADDPEAEAFAAAPEAGMQIRKKKK